MIFWGLICKLPSTNKPATRHVQLYFTHMKPPGEIPQITKPRMTCFGASGVSFPQRMTHYPSKANSFHAQKSLNLFHAIDALDPPSPRKAITLYRKIKVATAIWQWHPSREIMARNFWSFSTNILKPCAQKTKPCSINLHNRPTKKLLSIADITVTHTVA